jgi:hypothetical protein
VLQVIGIEYLSATEYLSRGTCSRDELVERLYRIKFMSWDFLVQRYLKDGLEDEKVKELLKDQFESRITVAGDLQQIVFTEGVGPFGYISPLKVKVEERGGRAWYEDDVFSCFNELTGEGTNSTHDPDGNVIVCPEIGVLPVLPHRGDFVCPGLFDKERTRAERIGSIGKNLVRYTMLQGWHGGAERICAYTPEDKVGFHQSMNAVMMGPLRGEGPSGMRRALMHYQNGALLLQIRELARQQSRKDRSASSRREMKKLRAAIKKLERRTSEQARLIAGNGNDDNNKEPTLKRVS